MALAAYRCAMTSGGTNRLIPGGAVLLALILVATACAGSATLTETSGSGTATPDESTTTATVSPIEPTASVVQPTTVPAPSPPAEPTPAATTPQGQPPVPTTPPQNLPPAEFSTDNILAISNDGAVAWAGTTSPWNDETSCDAPSTESLAVVSLVAAAQGDVAAVGAGLEQTGDVRQLIVGDEDSAAILSSCGPTDSPTIWLQRAEISAAGQVVGLGEVFPLAGDSDSESASEPYLLGWKDDEFINTRVIIEVDPDDYETWIVERREISMSTGESVTTEQFSILDDEGFSEQSTLVTPEGFTYRAIDDPNGSVGCEGFGVARTLELDDGNEQRVALTQPDLVSTIDDLHMSSSGHIVWTTGCEGYVSAFVGKVQADGMIADAHLVDTYALEADDNSYAEYQFYRLTDDGFLVAIGQTYDVDSDTRALAVLRYDLATDPNFVNTAEPPVDIDATPLFDAITAGDSWHVGETLASDRACGGKTLYGQTAGGFVRAFPAGVEIDTIVDVDLAETRTIEYDEGSEFVSRTVVVQTGCSGAYDGRQVWFGTETDRVVWGLTFEQADLGEVADVLSVRDVVQAGTDYVESSVVEVELFDGSVVEVELVAIPRN